MTAQLQTANAPAEVELLVQECPSRELEKVREIFEGYIARTYIYMTGPEERALDKFWSVLWAAAKAGRADILSYLFGAGCPFSSSYVWPALEAKSAAVFEVFLQHGWDINEPLKNAIPPALALVVNDWELTNWFLDHGADPNARSFIDTTPFSHAIQNAPLQTIQLFFNRGGNIQKGQLIHHTVERKIDEIEVVDLLLDKGASLNVTKYHNDLQSFNQEFFLGLGTPLHAASSVGKVELVSYLLRKGADPSIKDSNGRTALDCAKQNKHTKVVSLLEKV